jgi:endogenous inhibitor of DNA gyrase (YacG/DUF329 family)
VLAKKRRGAESDGRRLIGCTSYPCCSLGGAMIDLEAWMRGEPAAYRQLAAAAQVAMPTNELAAPAPRFGASAALREPRDHGEPGDRQNVAVKLGCC